MELLIYYGAIFLFYALINIAIYGSAILLVRRYLKSGKSKLYLLIWPSILIILNLYVLIGLPITLKGEFNTFDAGVVYEKASGIETVYFEGRSACDQICGELLLEGHVKRVIANHSEGLSYYQKSNNPNCLIDNLLSNTAAGNAMYFYQQRCVQQFRVLSDNADEFLNHAENRNNSVSILQETFFSDGLPVSPQFGFTKFVNGTWIFNEDENGKTKTLSIIGKLIPERPMTPLIVESLRSSFTLGSNQGWANSRNFDIFMTTELHFDSKLLADSYSDERQALYQDAEVRRRKLIRDTLGIELDGTILDDKNLPSVSVAKRAIQGLFDGHAHWQRSSSRPPIYEFAKLYNDYPFIDVFSKYKNHPVDRFSKLADQYIEDAWCYQNPVICKQLYE